MLIIIYTSDCSLFISYCRVVFVADDKDHVTSPLPVQTEREKVIQHLKQLTDTAARQQDELRQAADRETQLQRQLNKMKDDVSQLQTQLQQETQRSKQLTEFIDFRKYYNAEHGRCMRIKSAIEKALS